MKLTVFQPLNKDGTYGPSWSWHARSGPEIVASAHGYNSASNAVRACLNHGAQWHKMMNFGAKMTLGQKLSLRERITIVRKK